MVASDVYCSVETGKRWRLHLWKRKFGRRSFLPFHQAKRRWLPKHDRAVQQSTVFYSRT